MRSERMMSEPCVSTTLPSKVAVFFASSAVMLFDSMFTGLSRSPRSASAGAASTDIAAITMATGRLLPEGRIEGASDLRLERELLFGPVDDHADAGDCRPSIGNRYGLVCAVDSLAGEYVQELRARLELRFFGRGLSQHQHVAVQESLIALAIYRPAVRGRGDVAAPGRNLDHARIKHFAGTVVGEMLHLRSRECVLELSRGVQVLDGEVFDYRVGFVLEGTRLSGPLAHRVLQPQSQQPQEGHQGEREQGRDARFHASWRAMVRSSVS